MNALRRAVVAGVCAALAGTGLIAAAGPAFASSHWAGADPAHNIAPRPNVYTASACHHPRSRACSKVIIRALNHARAVVNKPAYHLPDRFLALTPAEQLLVLTDGDRHTYGLPQVRGLNNALDTSAHYGAVHDRDPSFVPVVHHHHLRGATANWAGGTGPIENPIFAYYEWMYDDGPGSPNADCRHRGDPGCWGHRHNTLWKFGSDQILMGAGGGRDRRGFQTWATLYESFSPNVTMTFIPSVTGLSHHNGTTRGGTVVRIYGYGFVHVHAVRILGKSVPFSKVNATTLRIRTPRHAAGRGHVVVYGNGGTSHKTGAAEFRYRS